MTIKAQAPRPACFFVPPSSQLCDLSLAKSPSLCENWISAHTYLDKRIALSTFHFVPGFVCVAICYVSLHANCNISQLSQHQRAHIRLFFLWSFNLDKLHANFFCLFNVYELREAKEGKANKNKNTSNSLEILFSKQWSWREEDREPAQSDLHAPSSYYFPLIAFDWEHSLTRESSAIILLMKKRISKRERDKEREEGTYISVRQCESQKHKYIQLGV